MAQVPLREHYDSDEEYFRELDIYNTQTSEEIERLQASSEVHLDGEGKQISGGTPLGYLNRYLHTRYATSGSGAGFTNDPSTLSTAPVVFQGLRNSRSQTESNNPASYSWREITVVSGWIPSFRIFEGVDIQWSFDTTIADGFTQDTSSVIIDLGEIRSDGFVSGSTGFDLNRATGDAEFNNVTVRGDIIGNYDGSTTLSSSSILSNIGSTGFFLDSSSGIIAVHDIIARDFDVSGSNLRLGTSAGNPDGLTATAENNVSIGSEAGAALTEGTSNVFIGRRAGPTVTDGEGHVFIGARAGEVATGGSGNTFVGTNAGFVHASGDRNTAIGTLALGSATSGERNTAIGDAAGFHDSNLSMDRNTLIGRQAGATSATNGTENSICIGYQALSAGTNTVRLGNTSITAINGQVTFSATSDSRDKTDIVDNPVGLSYVNTINSKCFRQNPRGRYTDFETEVLDQEAHEAGALKNSNRTIGFLAQDMQAELDELEIGDFDFVDNSDSEHLSIKHGELTAILWKAVQELSAKNDALEARIEALEA